MFTNNVKGTFLNNHARYLKYISDLWLWLKLKVRTLSVNKVVHNILDKAIG